DLVFWFFICLLLTLLTTGASILCFYLAPPLFPSVLTILIFLCIILVFLDYCLLHLRQVVIDVLSVVMLLFASTLLDSSPQNKIELAEIMRVQLFWMFNAGLTLTISGNELVNYQKGRKEIDRCAAFEIAAALGILAIMVSSISCIAETQVDRVG
ncbi:hypothetical protein PFISCL1PPCAC_9024, partial [Pristionchus fissidentatus]